MNRRGFSLAELVLIIAATSFLGLIISNLPASVGTINKSKHTSVAQEIATKQIDYLRKRTFANLASGTNSFSDPSLSSLPGGAAAYTVMDCPSQVCTHQEKARQVEVRVSWNEGSDSKNVDLVTLIGDGGVGQ